MARLSFNETLEREALRLLRCLMAGESVPPEQVEAAKLTLAAVQAAEARKQKRAAAIQRKRARKRRLKERVQQAAADREEQRQQAQAKAAVAEFFRRTTTEPVGEVEKTLGSIRPKGNANDGSQ